MECITPTFDVNLDPNGLVVDLDGLYAWLARLRENGMHGECAMPWSLCCCL